MSLLGGIWKGAKKVVGGVGDVVKKVAPLASFIPGVGPLAAAGLGVAGGLAGTLNDKKPSLGGALSSAVGGGLMGYAGGSAIDKLQGMAGANGGGLAGAFRGIVGGNGASAATGAAGAARAAVQGANTTTSSNSGGGLGGALTNLAGTITGQNGATSQLQALGLLGSAAGAYMSGKSDDSAQQFNQAQIEYQRERNAQYDPIRQQLLQTIASRMGGGSGNMGAASPAPARTSPSPAGSSSMGSSLMAASGFAPPGAAPSLSMPRAGGEPDLSGVGPVQQNPRRFEAPVLKQEPYTPAPSYGSPPAPLPTAPAPGISGVERFAGPNPVLFGGGTVPQGGGQTPPPGGTGAPFASPTVEPPQPAAQGGQFFGTGTQFFTPTVEPERSPTFGGTLPSSTPSMPVEREPMMPAMPRSEPAPPPEPYRMPEVPFLKQEEQPYAVPGMGREEDQMIRRPPRRVGLGNTLMAY